ncbi:hypothetical protein CBR_g55335 [Chara braunii]|uniref:Uncharacterized protein n=1 Tax=Chara braunii TaxID=69332 RepID=A0A388MCW2_CHABU|nr:hypothetical protein CBR_g55335 [Chara braunii]|eukprot:GBG92401.1 hypothetical protein CBR_g55335 [Chara braunii]
MNGGHETCSVAWGAYKSFAEKGRVHDWFGSIKDDLQRMGSDESPGMTSGRNWLLLLRIDGGESLVTDGWSCGVDNGCVGLVSTFHRVVLGEVD